MLVEQFICKRKIQEHTLKNKIHIGSLPKNTKGVNNNENVPSSHRCPHVSKAFRDKLYNTYNKGSKNELKVTKVIYY